MSAYPILLLFSSVLSTPPEAPAVETINMEQFRKMCLHQDEDTLYVVNFWATWCRPCIEELPFFEKAATTWSDKKVKIILMSLDFASQNEKVRKFITEKKIKNSVFMLNAGNANTWIDEVDPTWSGAIPATILYKAGKKVLFHEGPLSQAELDQIIQSHLQ